MRKQPATSVKLIKQHIGIVFVGWVAFLLALLGLCAILNICHQGIHHQ